ncbi:hypothetical protein CIB84_009647 [Bambusicola thoracicus]|uniref:Uncharacterized protein n=1 Tax=Bambusicola thoracicus TaxID=9083 RepID=A0A2P4SR66_BAMTH|nr:hypothetical protein CIB84_009647 [Bambusicola thoracicus]
MLEAKASSLLSACLHVLGRCCTHGFGWGRTRG